MPGASLGVGVVGSASRNVPDPCPGRPHRNNGAVVTVARRCNTPESVVTWCRSTRSRKRRASPSPGPDRPPGTGPPSSAPAHRPGRAGRSTSFLPSHHWTGWPGLLGLPYQPGGSETGISVPGSTWSRSSPSGGSGPARAGARRPGGSSTGPTTGMAAVGGAAAGVDGGVSATTGAATARGVAATGSLVTLGISRRVRTADTNEPSSRTAPSTIRPTPSRARVEYAAQPRAVTVPWVSTTRFVEHPTVRGAAQGVERAYRSRGRCPPPGHGPHPPMRPVPYRRT